MKSLGIALRLGALVSLHVLTGCGEPAPTRYPYSGAVSWQGQPVPAGFIVFTPDSARDNFGPGAQAEIHAGRYSLPAAEGAIGGPHQVSIHGFDGRPYQDGNVTVANGRPLFAPYTTQVDLPPTGGTFDVSLPGEGGG